MQRGDDDDDDAGGVSDAGGARPPQLGGEVGCASRTRRGYDVGVLMRMPAARASSRSTALESNLALDMVLRVLQNWWPCGWGARSGVRSIVL